MITKGERDQLRALIQDPKFRMVERVAEALCENLKGNSNIKDSEFETLKSVLINEGEIRGVRRLIQSLYEEAKDA